MTSPPAPSGRDALAWIVFLSVSLTLVAMFAFTIWPKIGMSLPECFNATRADLEVIARNAIAANPAATDAVTISEGGNAGCVYWDEVWLEDGAVYFVQGSWVDDYGDVFDPDGRTWYATHGVEPFAPGWYQWQD